MDHVPNASLHEKFKIEDVRGRLMNFTNSICQLETYS